MTSAAVLPEVHEAEAPPEIAAIYAGLRQAVGVPIVNLIWRHFATLPGVLPWAWETTRGAIGSAAVTEGPAAWPRSCARRLAWTFQRSRLSCGRYRRRSGGAWRMSCGSTTAATG